MLENYRYNNNFCFDENKAMIWMKKFFEDYKASESGAKFIRKVKAIDEVELSVFVSTLVREIYIDTIKDLKEKEQRLNRIKKKYNFSKVTYNSDEIENEILEIAEVCELLGREMKKFIKSNKGADND